MKKTSILFLCLLFAGCSIFKKTTTQEDSQTHKVEQRDVLSNVAEDIDITIPPDLFAKLYGLELPEDSVRGDSVEKEDDEPVTISINRTSETKDKTEITTDKTEESKTEEVTEKETSDLIGGWKWLILVGGLVTIGVAWILIKKFV